MRTPSEIRMNLANKLARVVARVARIVNSRVLKRWGTPAAKQTIWDREFAGGQWEYLENTADDPVYGFLERYCSRGSILDLGCGSGNTGCELDGSRYRRYTGVDISGQAVRRACARAINAGRQEQNEYVCADIASFEPRHRYNVILFRESLFYIPRYKIVDVLERYREWLAPGGVIVARLCDRKRYGAIVGMIENNFVLLDRHVPPGGDIILVFR